MNGLDASAWLQSAFALAVVLGLVYAAARMARRFGAAGAGAPAVLRHVASLALGARERIVVVEAGEEWLVLGLAPGSIRTLHVMPRRELPAPAMPPFQQWLARAVRK